jgi:hypothetical protein
MITRRFFAISAALVPMALSLVGCGDDRWADYSYKMTVYVGGKAFSTVRRVEVTEGSSIQDSSGRRVDRKTTGEAVIIETTSGPVFALMVPADGQFGNGFYGAYVAEPALVPAIGRPQQSDIDQAVREYREDQLGFDQLADDAETHNAMLEVEDPRPLPRSIAGAPGGDGPTRMTVWPMLVRFGNISDPKTVQLVSPASIGVTNITIEITDEDVTTGIEAKLGWLANFGSKRLNGQRFGKHNSNNLSEQLSAHNFSTESPE